MTGSSSQLQVSGIRIDVVRKAIKNLHMSVLPPDGRVRVSVPLHVTDERVRAAVATRLLWIKKQQREFAAQPRQSRREMVTGEAHYFMGRCYRLEVIERQGRHEVAFKNSHKLQLIVHPGTTLANRKKALNEWYRQQLKEAISPLVSKCEVRIGVKSARIIVQKMKTKWGSCNPDSGIIRINLELAKKPSECLEYIVVHELLHLIERTHNNRFIELMDRFLPNWRLCRDALNALPVCHEDWQY